jgi:hypothetical protein
MKSSMKKTLVSSFENCEVSRAGPKRVMPTRSHLVSCAQPERLADAYILQVHALGFFIAI